MKTLKCTIGYSLRDRIGNENIRNICEIQDVREIRKRPWRDRINKMGDNLLTKIAKNGKSNIFKPPEWPPKC